MTEISFGTRGKGKSKKSLFASAQQWRMTVGLLEFYILRVELDFSRRPIRQVHLGNIFVELVNSNHDNNISAHVPARNEPAGQLAQRREFVPTRALCFFNPVLLLSLLKNN